MREEQVVAEGNRTDIDHGLGRTSRHRDRSGIKQPVSRRWLAPIQSVANGGAHRGRAQRQGEGAVEQAAGDTGERVGGQTAKERRPIVGRSRRRIGQVAEAVIVQAIGNVRALLGVGGQELRGDFGGEVRVEKPEVLARGAELEAGVQVAAVRRTSIFAGSEHQQILPRAQGHGREGPQPRLGGIIGQRPATEVHGRDAPIVELDPALQRPVLIAQAIGAHVSREELVDDHVAAEFPRVQGVAPPSFSEGIG